MASLKQAVYIKRSAGGGHRAESGAQDKESIQVTTTTKHRYTPHCLFAFIIRAHTFFTVGSLCAHVSTNTRSLSLSESTQGTRRRVQIPKKRRFTLKRLNPTVFKGPEFKCQTVSCEGKVRFPSVCTSPKEG